MTHFLFSFFNSDDADPSNLFMWIGLKAKIGADGGVYFNWVDGMYDSFTNWALGEPAGVTDQSCFYISNDLDASGKWYGTNNCAQSRPYVCKLELKSSLPDFSGEDKRGAVIPCDKPWETFGYHCYLPHKYGFVLISNLMFYFYVLFLVKEVGRHWRECVTHWTIVILI